MFGNNAPWTPYTPQPYRPQMYGQPTGQTAMDPGMVNARYVTCREEAVAAQILPDGNPYLFVHAAQGRIYVKSYNPQTQMPEFREYGMIQPQAQQEQQSAQYAPLDALAALNARVESLEQLLKQEAI